MKLILASSNSGKLAEYQHLLQPFKFDLIPQQAYPMPEVEETGLSFIENAILKARHASYHSGLPALADDSGLQVDALQGAPGIYSARYAGPNATDQQNNEKLLAALAGIPFTERQANFFCAIAWCRTATDPAPILCQGTWSGYIADTAQGTAGFGYDPLFFLPSLKQTAAQLTAAQKNQLSHRAQALQQLHTTLAEQKST
jgi:XTP/dITP diphosphohydrolase